MTKEKIEFDSHDLVGMRKLMDTYGDLDYALFGTNEDGEDVQISINHDSIVVETYQDNGWIRKNYYSYEDGPEGETFDGRWK